ncbi:hypothetical protein FB565_004409 [Actinoplanes lutulentus]|uniref:Uncharacterized protein n=1 Tax=Actinoplanes lutulentus TaxID=1287878 RepID=A0A327YZ41_9ACTN|nr:hypothetical protein [Actinoplanes lutulentus]RAK27117.1 hypothetical protein B0I29_1241 [Actinoplanes lutulentus]
MATSSVTLRSVCVVRRRRRWATPAIRLRCQAPPSLGHPANPVYAGRPSGGVAVGAWSSSRSVAGAGRSAAPCAEVGTPAPARRGPSRNASPAGAGSRPRSEAQPGHHAGPAQSHPPRTRICHAARTRRRQGRRRVDQVAQNVNVCSHQRPGRDEVAQIATVCPHPHKSERSCAPIPVPSPRPTPRPRAHRVPPFPRPPRVPGPTVCFRPRAHPASQGPPCALGPRLKPPPCAPGPHPKSTRGTDFRHACRLTVRSASEADAPPRAPRSRVELRRAIRTRNRHAAREFGSGVGLGLRLGSVPRIMPIGDCA